MNKVMFALVMFSSFSAFASLNLSQFPLCSNQERLRIPADMMGQYSTSSEVKEVSLQIGEVGAEIIPAFILTNNKNTLIEEGFCLKQRLNKANGFYVLTVKLIMYHINPIFFGRYSSKTEVWFHPITKSVKFIETLTQTEHPIFIIPGGSYSKMKKPVLMHRL